MTVELANGLELSAILAELDDELERTSIGWIQARAARVAAIAADPAGGCALRRRFMLRRQVSLSERPPVAFTLHPVRPPQRKELTMATHKTHKGSLHILLAEDNRQVRNLVATALYGDGHEVEEFGDGAELVEQLATLIVEAREDDIDLIISEQELPGIPGLSVLAGLRARGRAIPFVLMTGNEAVQSQAKALGAAILDRPSSVAAIRKAVKEATEMTGARRFDVTRPANEVYVVRRRFYGSA